MIQPKKTNRELLSLDIGNSNICFGLYKADKLIDLWRVKSSAKAEETLTELLSNRNVTDVVIASVVPNMTPIIAAAIGRLTEAKITVVSPPYTSLGMTINIEDHAKIGTDRIVNILAAIERYGAPAIVIDFGTATKFDYVDEHKIFMGGIIAPGLETSLDSLCQKAAQLSKVDIIRPLNVIGVNTSQAMQSGMYYGYIGLVEGILKNMLTDIATHPNIIATGGLAPLICAKIPQIKYVHPHLTIEGLKIYHDKISTVHDTK